MPPTPPSAAIRGLLEERDRYQSWIDAIEARRGVTPPHVFERVHADYAARLRGARGRLVEHVEPLRTTDATLSRRQDDVLRKLSEAQDELAEIELRTLVGEFTAEDGEQRVQQAGATVRELDAERRGVTTELEDVRALLQQIGVVRDDEMPARAAEPPAPVSASLPESAPSAPSAQTDDAPPSDGIVERTVAMPVAAHADATAPAHSDALSSAGRNVDTSAFLGAEMRVDAPAGSTPQPVSSGQERTLRCQDCGEMNFPTEWYCERCGGELAAL